MSKIIKEYVVGDLILLSDYFHESYGHGNKYKGRSFIISEIVEDRGSHGDEELLYYYKLKDFKDALFVAHQDFNKYHKFSLKLIS